MRSLQREEFVKISGEIFDAGVTFESGCDRSVEVSDIDWGQYGNAEMTNLGGKE